MNIFNLLMYITKLQYLNQCYDARLSLNYNFKVFNLIY